MLLRIVFGYGPAGGPGGKAPARATRLGGLPMKRVARAAAVVLRAASLRARGSNKAKGSSKG